jgi:glycosyltransferase involved in cell wall biosynthesis
MENAALDRCKLVIFASDWAAQTAMKTYEIAQSKIRVVPWGANLEDNRTYEDVKNIVKFRAATPCKLLFIGIDWFRKGGDIAIEVAKELNKMGLTTELLVVGCEPITSEPLPSYVKNLGFINKYTKEGINKMNQLFCESHFFIMPSRAESYGHVFCEANSFGVPCLATEIGGIPTIIKSGLNGKYFSLDASISEYCTYIASLMSNYSEYKRLAHSSFHEYQSRLNWATAGQTVKHLIRELV